MYDKIMEILKASKTVKFNSPAAMRGLARKISNLVEAEEVTSIRKDIRKGDHICRPNPNPDDKGYKVFTGADAAVGDEQRKKHKS